MTPHAQGAPVKLTASRGLKDVSTLEHGIGEGVALTLCNESTDETVRVVSLISSEE